MNRMPSDRPLARTLLARSCFISAFHTAALGEPPGLGNGNCHRMFQRGIELQKVHPVSREIEERAPPLVFAPHRGAESSGTDVVVPDHVASKRERGLLLRLEVEMRGPREHRNRLPVAERTRTRGARAVDTGRFAHRRRRSPRRPGASPQSRCERRRISPVLSATPRPRRDRPRAPSSATTGTGTPIARSSRDATSARAVLTIVARTAACTRRSWRQSALPHTTRGRRGESGARTL